MPTRRWRSTTGRSRLGARLALSEHNCASRVEGRSITIAAESRRRGELNHEGPGATVTKGTRVCDARGADGRGSNTVREPIPGAAGSRTVLEPRPSACEAGRRRALQSGGFRELRDGGEAAFVVWVFFVIFVMERVAIFVACLKRPPRLRGQLSDHFRF